jgi:hypothetical protein
MPLAASLRSFTKYFLDHGAQEAAAFACVKLRAMAARNSLVWNAAYVFNPWIATGKTSDYTEQMERTWDALTSLDGIEARQLALDVDGFRSYLAQADYAKYGPYYDGGISGDARHKTNKLLQHYLSLKLLEIQPDDIYIDVASNTSPMKEIVRRIYGAQSYAMDLQYEPGIHGDRIGCDAGHTGLPPGFASKMTLHCSFEHFSQGSDVRFVQECSRILRPGGRVCILPLYVIDRYSIRQDPTLEKDLRISDLEGAKRVFVRDYNVEYGRFYDPSSFKRRIIDARGDLQCSVYRFTNLDALRDGCYCHFALLLRKPA